jgi:L-malate glycosyltransferase
VHIALLGPVATEDILPLLRGGASAFPRGYAGAPLMAVLITELLARGHQVSAITLSSDLPLRTDAAVRANGERFTMRWCPMRPRAWPMNGWRPGRIVDLYRFERQGLLRALQATQAELVHAHWTYEFAAAALRSGLPHLVTAHDSPVQVARAQQGLRHSGYRWLRVLMARQVLRRAKALSAVSPMLAAELAPFARQSVPIDVVPNPLSPAVWRLTQQPQAGRQRVLMVGHGYGPLKNSDTALRAFAALAQQRPDAELLLVGHGFGPGEAAQTAWGSRLPQARFLGALPHGEVLQQMASSDVLLHASTQESFGVVVAEALAIGLPVLAGRDSGAVPWLAAGQATLVDVRDAAAISTALAQMLSAGDTPGRSQRARQAMQDRFAVARVVDAYEALYRRVLTFR